MVFGFDAPLPPARSGVADYAAVLLEELRRRTTVVLPGRPADRWLYHVGNNREHHAAIYKRALERPGAVVLHDAVLMHLHLSMCGSADEFAAEFTHNYGAWHRDHAHALWRNRARSGADAEYFRWPMLKRLAESARVVIVHNPGAARRVREHVPAAHVEEIPHLAFSAEAAATRILDFRARWGSGMDTFVFAVFGHLRDSKRIQPILRTLAPHIGPRVRLVLCGEAQNEGLERAIELSLSPHLLREPALSADDLPAAIAAADAVLCLRWPPAGETSGIMIRAMAAGKAVLVTAGEETASYPEGVVLKIESGLAEENHLDEAVRWLLHDTGRARRMGALAQEHIARYHAPSKVADRYLEVLSSCG